LTNSGGILFDNILVTNSEADAKTFALNTWAARNAAEKKASGEDSMSAKAVKSMETAQALVMDLAEDKPMVLAALAGGLLVAVISMLYVCCCSGSPKAVTKPATKSKANVKKTDAPSENDVAAEAADDDDSEITPAAASPGGGGSGAKKRASRRD